MQNRDVDQEEEGSSVALVKLIHYPCQGDTELISTKKQKCGRVQSPFGLTQTGWGLWVCDSTFGWEGRKNRDCGERKGGRAARYWGDANWIIERLSRKGGETVYLRIEPRRTVETNKLFWLLRRKNFWWKRHRTSHWEGREGSVGWDSDLAPTPLKLWETAGAVAAALVPHRRLPGATQHNTASPFATWSKRRNAPR